MQNRKGLTLIEVIVSMVLLAILALGVFSIFSLMQASQRTSIGSLNLLATNYAREILESLKNRVSTNPAIQGTLGTNNVTLGSYSDATCGSNPSDFGKLCGSAFSALSYSVPITVSINNVADDDAANFISRYGASRVYKVVNVSDGKGGVAYKKVTVTVTWN